MAGLTSTCCGSDARTSCCAPDDKAACCGGPADGSCGCPAGAATPAPAGDLREAIRIVRAREPAR